jgi:hypothetical protein
MRIDIPEPTTISGVIACMIVLAVMILYMMGVCMAEEETVLILKKFDNGHYQASYFTKERTHLEYFGGDTYEDVVLSVIKKIKEEGAP